MSLLYKFLRLEITHSMKFHCSGRAFFFQNAFQTWRNLTLCQWEITDFSPLEKFNIVAMESHWFFSIGEI